MEAGVTKGLFGSKSYVNVNVKNHVMLVNTWINEENSG